MQFNPDFSPNKKMVLGAGLVILSFVLFAGFALVKVLTYLYPTSLGVRQSYDIGTTTVVMFGAGDISECGNDKAAFVSSLISNKTDVVFTLGDNVYGEGDRFGCFDDSWGVWKNIARPSLGNHDYDVNGAKDYFEYFGNNAGDKDSGYYSYDAGAWHVVVLNSNCTEVSCGESSKQLAWLKEDLENSGKLCTLAYWHHPRFSSGNHGGELAVKPFWDELYKSGAELILAGHSHNYERFAPQNPMGELDIKSGIREIVVGTGGRALTKIDKASKNSEVFNDKTHGLLRLDLGDKGYVWQFVSLNSAFSDIGGGNCR